MTPPRIRTTSQGPQNTSEASSVEQTGKADPGAASAPKTGSAPQESQAAVVSEKAKSLQKAEHKMDGQLKGLQLSGGLKMGVTATGLTATATTKTQSAREAPANTIIDAGNKVGNDSKYDGAFVGANPKAYSSEGAVGQAWSSKTDWTKIDGVKPNNGKTASGKCLYINGMNTSIGRQSTSLQEIANSTGQEVIGIHNSTDGFVKDVAQCLKDKMNIGNNGAHKTLTDAIYNHVKAHPDEPLNIVAHSQGGIITSRALRDVKNRLRLEDGMSGPDVDKALANVRVQTAGAAAVQYPSGPQYLHHVNTLDPVPQAFGSAILGGLTDPGKHGPVHRFTKTSAMHSMNATYASQLVPFENLKQAQAQLGGQG